MKYTIEIPDKTVCAVVSYVYYTDNGMSLGNHLIGTDDIYSQKEGWEDMKEQGGKNVD